MKKRIINILDIIAVFFIKAIILILGFVLWTGLTHSLLASLQAVCDTIP